jgi:hypothetical protein
MEATHKVDEVDRIAVRLPDDATFYGTPMFVAIAVDLGCEGIEPVLLGQHHRLRFLAQYEVMSLLCDDRAQLAVDGQLRCRGARVTPEHYLALWRKALLAPLSAQELYEQHGWSLIARLKGRCRTHAGATARLAGPAVRSKRSLRSGNGTVTVWSTNAKDGSAWTSTSRNPTAPGTRSMASRCYLRCWVTKGHGPPS